MTVNPYESIDAELVADAQASDSLAKNLYELCDLIGPRFAGSPGYRRAADLMLDRFASYGLDHPRLEPLDFSAWHRGTGAILKITDPIEQVLPCYDLVYSCATGPRGVHGQVVHLGDGTAERFEANRDRLPGCFVLVTKRGTHRMAVYEQCVQLGAAGLIYTNPAGEDLLCAGSVGDGEVGDLPAVSITQETGQALARIIDDEPVHLHLTTNSRCEPGVTWNVLGELTGGQKPEEMVIVGGHLDSHDIGPGAYDNAAGAVMVMEMARLLARQREHIKRTIRFIGFAAEEVGLCGSHHHAQAHRAELARTRLMFNCDMPGINEPWIIAAHRFEAFESYLPKLSRQMGLAMTYRRATHHHSDHYPFTRRGVPGLALAGSRIGLKAAGFGHTAADTAEKIPTDQLARAAAVGARIVLRAANECDWPASDHPRK